MSDVVARRIVDLQLRKFVMSALEPLASDGCEINPSDLDDYLMNVFGWLGLSPSGDNRRDNGALSIKEVAALSALRDEMQEAWTATSGSNAMSAGCNLDWRARVRARAHETLSLMRRQDLISSSRLRD